MAVIRPFCCIHPAKGMEPEIAALPYDVYHREDAREAVLGKPLSFLNIDRPETMFPPEQDMYAPEVYEAGSKRFWKMVEDGYFVKEEMPVYYLYELTMDGRSQTGLVACASVDDYQNQVIKKHENTREEKELDRIRHVEACRAQTGPIFLTYRAQEEIRRLTEEVKSEEPDFSFVSEDGIRHAGWKISEEERIRRFTDAFGKLDSIYIADGHHRAASAVKAGLRRRTADPEYTGEEDFNYFLSVLFPDDELLIMDYNRLVKDLNGLSEEGFLQKVDEKFDRNPLLQEEKPHRKGQIHMYLNGKWYELNMKREFMRDDPVGELDVSYLQRELLQPVLGIGDPRTDKRIDFAGGTRCLQELEQEADRTGGAAFFMYPTSIRELFQVSDAGLLMPPKSTWFEPKLRSGLFIHAI